MPAPGTDWLPAVAMFVFGVVVALVVANLVSKRRAAVAPTPPTQDLAARRDSLVEQLRNTPDAQDRQELELELARVLRELDKVSSRAVARNLGGGSGAGINDRVTAPPPGSLAEPVLRSEATNGLGMTAGARGFLWGAGTVGVLALVVLLLTRNTTERSEGAPVTGAAVQDAGRPDADIARLERAVQQNPNDIEARLDLARAYLMSEQLMQVFEHTQAVLEKEPDNPRALSYQALVRLAMGQSDLAMEMLQRALARDPDSLDARVHLAIVHATNGDRPAAMASLEEAIRRHPEERAQLTQLMAQINAAPASEAAGPAAIADPPLAATSGQSVELLVESTRAASGVLFVVARPEGVAEGAPIAAKRVNATTFPLRVIIGPGDSMMGGQLTEKLRIDVRLDSDGDPLTRPATDPAGFVDGVSRGATNVRVTLR